MKLDSALLTFGRIYKQNLIVNLEIKVKNYSCLFIASLALCPVRVEPFFPKMCLKEGEQLIEFI